MNILRILWKKPGFRRAGIAHPDTPMIYPADRFNAAQLDQLKAEPKLDVIETEGNLPEGVELPKDGIPEAELKAIAEAARSAADDGKKGSASKGGAKT
ncbi:MAG: HI1506-related protein [Alphaproteobacteria bacterium]|nr:HI1506-related protein [Alphaproteobacteria bacterium]